MKSATVSVLDISCDKAEQSALVARRLDQLEDFGRYSVIYEITRIETMLNEIFMQDLQGRLARLTCPKVH